MSNEDFSENFFIYWKKCIIIRKTLNFWLCLILLFLEAVNLLYLIIILSTFLSRDQRSGLSQPYISDDLYRFL